MLLIVFIVLIFTYSLVSRPLEQTIITAPVVFTLVGMIAGFLAPESQQGGFSLDLFLRLAEIGLVLLLFTDASRRERAFRRDLAAKPRKSHGGKGEG